MLAKRIVLALTLNDGVLFRTKRFRPDYRYTLNFVDLELADEILLLDVTRNGTRDSYRATVDRFSRELFLPTTIGGRLDSLEEAAWAFREAGADKILVNTWAWREPEIITVLASKYGTQSIVVGIDVKDWHVWIDQGREDTGAHVLDWAREAVCRGAGELVLMDMDRDGSLQGYNYDLVGAVSRAVDVPVVAVGGCGNWQHMHEGFAAGADACATACIHHFTNTSLRAAKDYLAGQGLPMRMG
jgi:cyclase